MSPPAPDMDGVRQSADDATMPGAIPVIAEAKPVFAPGGPAARLGWWCLAVTFAADQVHKWWMLQVWKLAHGQRITVTPFLDIVYVTNPGISYSLLPSLGQLPLTLFAVVASVVLAAWICYTHLRLVAASLGLIAGGALGNALDRMHLGGVADFFSLHAGSFSWYVFNIADVGIVAGVAGLLYDSVITSRKNA